MGSVFLPSEAAHSLLKRLRRANSALEEIKQGNIQRECREESCNYEEAREAFEDDEKTRRFWEEYVRENSPGGPGGLGSGIGQFQSLYLILPLLVGLLLIAVVMVSVWRCHSRKLFQRNSGFGHTNQDPAPAFVAIDRQGRSYHPDMTPPSNLSAPNSPVQTESDLTPGRMSNGDPPPSYEEAMGHSDPPPQYEDIINTGATRVMIGQGK
ncbi:transmembrane gamma-carboxyglutamic acid protein 1 [Megalops cyprinoides]|uniref:transmembrane gamma-carboxyglutamic acid protein 1 n=1 Tax=Megalops cyprinoides TaxID=118141 RepID=UPI001864A3D7|nr:transmembrane gamma-carboxyglutamic acid protein 1 [Megalops cyprinoides]